MGTVTYMAPEVITTGVAEAPADVYAVGIMLYEFLTGELPFQAETPIATAYMHINEPMPHVAEQADWIPASLDSFIALLTAKDASQRPANGEEALRELLAITRSIPEEDLIRRIPVIPAPQSARHRPPRRSRPAAQTTGTGHAACGGDGRTCATKPRSCRAGDGGRAAGPGRPWRSCWRSP